MTKYRVIQQKTYHLGVPILYTVQRSEKGFFGIKWVDIKSFDRKSRAHELLDTLKCRR